MNAPHVWNLNCPWCSYYIAVSPRGGHDNSQGNGYDAAVMMQHHVALHDRTWQDFLWADLPEEES